MLFLNAFLFTTVFLICSGAATEELKVPYATYYSRPDLKAPFLNVSLRDPRLSFGYIFTTPYFNDIHKPDSGPYIFANSGTLVWSGLDASGGAGATDVQGLHVCKYRGSDHLCYWQGLQRGMHGSGLGIIMNQHYQIVKTVQSGTATASTDLHEFRLTKDDNALITIYHPRFHNGLWILDSMFQEISLNDSHVIFEWSALDHIDPSESHVPVGSFGLAGDGSRAERSWDYFHINSIDKNDDGDYLISARHMDCIIKVSRLGGSTIWRLHGDNSTFHLSDFTFRRQHHARFREDSENRTVLSLFNNDNDGFIFSGGASTGLVVEIDHLTRIATKMAEYGAPVDGGIVAKGMGSMTYLPNENLFLSWGSDSAMAEILANGTAIWFADIGWKSYNYRSYKSHWIGKPLQPPALWTYAKSHNSPTAFYVSWNGATEIAMWRFHASISAVGVYELVGSKLKDGFETMYVDEIYRPWAFVEAIDFNGVSLGNSSKIWTYVPDINISVSCGATECFPSNSAFSNDYENESWATETSAGNTLNSCVMTAAKERSFWRWAEILLELLGIAACLMTGFRLLRLNTPRPASYTLLNISDSSVI